MNEYTKVYDDVRKRIFDLLEEKTISQKEFAGMLEVSPQTITDWKKSKSNSFMQSLDQISQVLNTTPGWLVSGTGEKQFSAEQREEWIRQDKLRSELWDKQLEDEMKEIYFSTLEKIFARQGITKSDFYEISQGRTPSPEKVQFISKVFDITPEQLFEIAKSSR